MKSEKIRRAIGGIDDDIIEAAESRRVSRTSSKVWVRCGAVAAAFVLLLTGALTLPGVLKQNSPVIDNTSVAEGTNKTGAEGSVKTDAETKNQDTPDVNVIWADNSTMDADHRVEGLTEWGKFNSVSIRLYEALETGNSDDVFAILARPAIDYDFEYKGKTIAAYYSDMCEEKNLPDLLSQLLKEGDSLKYGTALYETGTPDGEKWDKSFYEERIKYYGDAILEKYIVNGEFLKDKLEQDLEKAKNSTEATDHYIKAVAVYLDQIAAAIHGSLPSEVVPEYNGIIIYLTKDQFSSFTFDGVEGWTWDLAVKDKLDTAIITYGVNE